MMLGLLVMITKWESVVFALPATTVPVEVSLPPSCRVRATVPGEPVPQEAGRVRHQPVLCPFTTSGT